MNVVRTLLIFGALVCGLPAHAADMTKTLRVAFATAENGFDPQAIYDTYSDAVCSAIFDPLYSHDYFARPVRMVPNTAESLPRITPATRSRVSSSPSTAASATTTGSG